MKSYFIFTNDQQKGPFSVQELKDMNIGEGTPIWKEGFETWKKAGEIAELRVCFEGVPPPYNPAVALTTPAFNQLKKASSFARVLKTFVSLLLWGIALVLGIAVTGMIMNNVNGDSSTTLNFPALDPEKSNPSNYLNATGTYNKNFWGDRITIKGVVTNTATHTNYKDVNIRVEFYSKTKSVVQSQDFILYDYFPYGMTKNFELKVSIPANMESCGWDATNATAY